MLFIRKSYSLHVIYLISISYVCVYINYENAVRINFKMYIKIYIYTCIMDVIIRIEPSKMKILKFGVKVRVDHDKNTFS